MSIAHKTHKAGKSSADAGPLAGQGSHPVTIYKLEWNADFANLLVQMWG